MAQAFPDDSTSADTSETNPVRLELERREDGTYLLRATDGNALPAQISVVNSAGEPCATYTGQPEPLERHPKRGSSGSPPIGSPEAVALVWERATLAAMTASGASGSPPVQRKLKGE
ncbi:hypothetical protein AB0I81_51035 [Nonomuraea sp. NPDC050404]|uniref:hypothetical protein n=1 Tax=Nonomuraea sp. NPDC050404 TaxID=3155783 RepID=UPI0033DB55A4